MAPFACPNCRWLLHFEARICPGCGFTVGYDPASDQFLFLGDAATTWRDAEGGAHATMVCANNNAFEVCNWLIGTDDTTPFCRACRHNRTIPDLSGPRVPERWGKVEAAKRRLFHSLLSLGLPLETQAEASEKGVGQGLAFDILYDAAAEESGQQQIMTGHEAGLITLNLIEADDAQRERIRTEMGEPYRTLLGHFRHEVGHHYWARLIEKDPAELNHFRAVFGDETADYRTALQNHYGNGGGGWSTEYVSAYATSHPWEDFAETFAHYLHMVDTLATIGGFGMRLDPFPGAQEQPKVDFDPYRAEIRQLVDHWIPMAFALNAINRSMGQQDLYPFTLTEPVIGKLAYVRAVVAKAAGT